jgi:drug/metabolite transporter (DMT)-like permease
LLWVKPIKNQVSNYRLIFYRSVLTSLFFCGIFFLVRFQWFDFGLKYQFVKSNISVSSIDLIAIVSLCFFSFFGLYFFTSSLYVNKFSFATPLASSGFVFSIIVATFLNKSSINTGTLIAFFIFFIAILFIAKQFTMSDFKLLLLPILLTHFFWDSAVVLYPMAIQKVGIILFCLIMELTVCLMSFIFCVIKDNRRFFHYLSSEIRLYYFRIIGMAICITTAIFLLSFSILNLSIVLIISIGIFMKLIRVLYGYYFLKEKLYNSELFILLLLMIAGVIASLNN